MTLVRTRVSVVCAGVILSAAAGVVAFVPVAAAAPSSALSGVSIQTIVVSPAYARTGVVVATGTLGYPCKSACYHMWVSQDRGASWQQTAAGGWKGGPPVMAVDRSGKEHLFTGVSGGVQRSDDLGKTWSDVGAGGNPAVSPSFPSDSLLAVAGSSDYIVKDGSTQCVSGSGGTMQDGYWAVMPGFPSTGSSSPVLLGGIDSSGKSTVEQCTSSFACSSPVVLPVADAFAGPPLILPSTTYSQDRTVFAHTGEGVFKSTDGGSTFVPVTPPVAGATHVATSQTALSPSFSENGPDRRVWEAVLAVRGTGKDMTLGGDLYSSTDGGLTWKGVGSPGPFDRGSLAVAVAPDGRIFAAPGPTAGAGLLCSPNGTTWLAYCPGPGGRVANGSTGAQHGSTGACSGATCPPTTRDAPGAQGAIGASTPSPPVSGDPALVGSTTPGQGKGSSSGKTLLAALLGAIAVALIGASGIRALVRRRRPAAG